VMIVIFFWAAYNIDLITLWPSLFLTILASFSNFGHKCFDVFLSLA
jgi:hypothetical protein